MVPGGKALFNSDSVQKHLSSYGSGGGKAYLPNRPVADSRVTLNLRNTRRNDDSLWNSAADYHKVCRDRRVCMSCDYNNTVFAGVWFECQHDSNYWTREANRVIHALFDCTFGIDLSLSESDHTDAFR